MSQKYVELTLDELALDLENPRLPKELNAGAADTIVNWLLDETSLIDLMLAIGNNGYFVGEPLLVAKENDKYVVVEGNRRLSCLMLLQHPEIATKQKSKVNRVIELTSERPTLIPCILFDAREDIEQYLGFKHVTGVKEWSVLAKARYLNGLLPRLVSQDANDQYKELAKKIGSKADYVRRLLVAYQLYLLIEDNDFFKIPGLTETTLYFGYLVDCLHRVNIREFIGVEINSPTPVQQLAQEEYLQNFENLIDWFFRKNEFNKTLVKGDSKSLTKLDTVLSHHIAKEKFCMSGDLEAAFSYTEETSVSFHSNLSQSLNFLELAQGQIHKIEQHGVTDKDVLTQIHSLARILLGTIKQKEEDL